MTGAFYDPFAAAQEAETLRFPPMEGPAAQAPPVEALIYLPGERPPTLMDITAPRLSVCRGVAIALTAHVAVLGAALWLTHVHMPRSRSDAVQVALVMESTPHGNTSAPVPVARMAPPPEPAMSLAKPPSPPVPGAVAAAALPLPVPVPPAPPATAPAAKAPLYAVQGSKVVTAHVGAQMVLTDRPAAPDVGNSPPYYPPVARALGEEGEVDLAVQVLANGAVGRVVVARSSGFPRLDEAARQSLLSWHFRVALKQGVPVGSVFTYYVRYQLH
jgi:protein TonB